MYTVSMKRILLICLAFIICMCPIGAPAEREVSSVKNGDRTEDATRVQKRLFELGYYTYKPTGSYGNVTARAVQAFQSQAGLPVTGAVSEEDWKMLFSADAPVKPFLATIPVRFTAQGSYFNKFGELVSWEKVRPLLQEGQAYRVTNCVTGNSCKLTYVSGSGHADMRVVANSTDAVMLKDWLGNANDFYKLGAVMEIDGLKAACSLQWDGKTGVCVYFYGSVSHVNGLQDCEHNSLVLKAAGR